jgi:hypothetical protein
MSKQHAPTPEQVAGLRAHAARRREQTAERVRDAVRILEGTSRNVTAAAIEKITGIGFTALKRNTDAYAEFCRHSTQLRTKLEQERAGDKRKRGADVVATPGIANSDPLMHHTKLWLVAELRRACAERDEAQQRYRALLQEHMGLQGELRDLRHVCEDHR